MRISDTLDQLLRSLLVPSNDDPLDETESGAQRPAAPPESDAADDVPAPLAIDLEAAAAEVAVKRAHELIGPGEAADDAETAGTKPDTKPRTDAKRRASELSSLETSAGAIENLGLGFHLGAAIERIALAAGEGSEGRLKLREASWLIERYISLLEQRPVAADLHASSLKLARTGETLAGLQELKEELEGALVPSVPPATPTTSGAPVAPPAAPEPAAQQTEAGPSEAGPSEPGPAIAAPTLARTSPVTESEGRPQVVHELPSIRRELFVTTLRAVIAVVSVILLVLVLTLIAQTH